MTKRCNDLASRSNEGKDPLHLIPLELMGGVARVIEFGNLKYGANDWKSGFKYSTMLASISRHYAAIRGGEDIDPDSGCYHVEHIITNCLHFLWHLELNRTDLDDRAQI